MAKASRNPDHDQDRLGDVELANQRRREADLKLTMSERLEQLNDLCRQLGEIEGIAKR